MQVFFEAGEDWRAGILWRAAEICGGALILAEILARGILWLAAEICGGTLILAEILARGDFGLAAEI